MGREIWITSDTHFNHKNILEFSPARKSRWSNVKEMNEELIDNWNSVVKPQYIIYHLGDVFFGSKEEYLEIHGKLQGRKRLVIGNHDTESKRLQFMMEHKMFQKYFVMREWHQEELLFTHVPVHEGELWKRVGKDSPINIHGHTHDEGEPDNSGFYFCACVEQNNFKPVNLDEIMESMR